MAEVTNISWADSTLNIWAGCTKVSPACDGCYAEHLMDRRMGRAKWGPHEQRVEMKGWREELRRISQKALEAQKGQPGRLWLVFVNSLSDFWDNQADPALRREAFDEFRKHPHLTFLTLTKRPGNIETLYLQCHQDPPDGGSGYDWPANVWAGCTVANQDEAPEVLKLARAASQLGIPLIFVSCEPLLGPVDFFDVIPGPGRHYDAFAGVESVRGAAQNFWKPLGWVISGGETDQGKHKARPTHADWETSLQTQCDVTGTPYHRKQAGEWLTFKRGYPGLTEGALGPVLTTDGKTYRGDRLHFWLNGDVSAKVGKKAAGRELDGVIHDARPVIA